MSPSEMQMTKRQAAESSRKRLVRPSQFQWRKRSRSEMYRAAFEDPLSEQSAARAQHHTQREDWEHRRNS